MYVTTQFIGGSRCFVRGSKLRLSQNTILVFYQFIPATSIYMKTIGTFLIFVIRTIFETFLLIDWFFIINSVNVACSAKCKL